MYELQWRIQDFLQEMCGIMGKYACKREFSLIRGGSANELGRDFATRCKNVSNPANLLIYEYGVC